MAVNFENASRLVEEMGKGLKLHFAIITGLPSVKLNYQRWHYGNKRDYVCDFIHEKPLYELI